MKCCAECFGDRGLRRSIIPLRSTEIGQCSYCNSENVAIVVPSQLSEYFELLISAYRQDAGGKLLVQLFREEWGLFGHSCMDDSRAKDLLAEILDDGEIVRQTFAPIDYIAEALRKNLKLDIDLAIQVGAAMAQGRIPHIIVSSALSEWEELRDELMHHNRFFPETRVDLKRLEFLFSFLTLSADEVPDLWYRARIQSGEASITASEMGAPPKRIASHGRANPAGIPYLYLGSSPLSAIAEIRPQTGEVACVAEFRTPHELKIVDLRSPRKMVSPFLLEDTEDICRMRSDLPFLEQLGDELTRPVLPQAAAIDYTPSQYLCEFIKKCGYGGVIYRSSVSDGMNLALFDPKLAQCGTVTQYRVARVSVDATLTGA